MHSMFHMSMLRKYLSNESHVLQPQAVEVNFQMSYVEEPIAIVYWQVRKLRSKEIPSVKVIWNHHNENEASWELEEDMRKLYPQLFQKDMFNCFKNSKMNFLKRENCKTLVFMRSYMISKLEV